MNFKMPGEEGGRVEVRGLLLFFFLRLRKAAASRKQQQQKSPAAHAPHTTPTYKFLHSFNGLRRTGMNVRSQEGVEAMPLVRGVESTTANKLEFATASPRYIKGERVVRVHAFIKALAVWRAASEASPSVSCVFNRAANSEDVRREPSALKDDCRALKGTL